VVSCIGLPHLWLTSYGISDRERLDVRCLTPNEAVDLFGRIGFGIVSGWYGNALQLEPEIASRQTRIGGRPTPSVGRLAHFAEALNRWHPPNVHRLLWVSHCSNDFPSTHDLFVAARTGLGETRSLSEAPGHYFDPYPYDERDQLKISPEQARETGLLAGLMSLLMINGWDGWLIADGSADRIEFWEGNLFFYSATKSRLVDADALMDEFDCPRMSV
jgi:hypothetical protein